MTKSSSNPDVQSLRGYPSGFYASRPRERSERERQNETLAPRSTRYIPNGAVPMAVLEYGIALVPADGIEWKSMA